MKKEPEKPVKIEPKSRLTPLRSTLSAIGIYVAAQVIAVSLVVFYAAAIGVESSNFEQWFEANNAAKLVLYLLIAGIGIAGVGLVLRGLKQRWSVIGFKKAQAKDIAYAIGGYLVYMVFYILSAIILGLLIPGLDFEQEQQLDFSTSISGVSLAAVFISLVVLPPLYEEILTRGLMFTGLRSRLSFWHAGIITSLLFAAAHLQWGANAPLLWAAAIDTFVLSMVLVYLREKTGSLWPTIGVHAIKNFVAFSLLFVFKIG